MNIFRFSIGIILLIVAIGMFFYIEDIKNDRVGFFGTTTAEDIVKMCNAGWGDVFNMTGQCLKVQLFYYSPWISGFFGIIFLAKAGPYRGYSGYGGAGSHNRRIRLRPRTKKKIVIIISIIVAITVGTYLYANYDITVGNQKIDNIIPPNPKTTKYHDPTFR
ncbi:MAG: hypothetical protein EB163_08955 [Nitrososphaeria archaeon]|nr:hypothetical protein [Nitrososphaeria archaeon]